MSVKFCIAPWVHIYLSTEGDVLPCCASLDVNNSNRFGSINTSSIENIFNSDAMKQLRIDMINHIPRPDVCKACYEIEASGFKSIRQGFNEAFLDSVPDILYNTSKDGYVDPTILSWDIRYSNLCNLKCRTCSSFFSSAIAQEEGKDVIKLQAISDTNIDPLISQYQNVRNIYFAGGEPLINYEHFRTIKHLVDLGYASNVSLSYNTNCTKLDYDKNSLLVLWRKFKGISVGVSIDAVGSRAEYIRNGVKWKTIENNLKQLLEFKLQQKNFHYFYSVTVSALNVYHLTDMHRYLWDSKLMYHINDIQFNLLMSPAHYSCKVLPENIKIKIIKKIDAHVGWLNSVPGDKNNDSGVANATVEFTKIKNFLLTEFVDFENLKIFLEETEYKDTLRNEDFLTTFPEYKDLHGFNK